MTKAVQPGERRPHVRHNRDGTAAALSAGPALTISFVLAAIACGLVRLWIAVGLVIYFAYGRFQPRLRAK